MFAQPGASLPIGPDCGKIKKPEDWTNRFSQILKLVNTSVTALYDGVEKDEDNNLQEAGTEIQGESVEELADCLIQDCHKLLSMLCQPTNVPVKLPVVSLLAFISRCLKVTHADVASLPSMSELAKHLPAVHRAALRLLAQLVISCKSNLLPYSRNIINLCQQVLVSSPHLKLEEWSPVRVASYQCLCLVVQTFGWGQYFTTLSKIIQTELMADIKWQASITSVAVDSSKAEAILTGKKKKKKKNKGDSYNDLAKTMAVPGDSNQPVCLNENLLGIKMGALQFARLMLERTDFVIVENLMRCIIDTAQLLQREEPAPESPYLNTGVRKSLYSALFACSLVRLATGCNRKDCVSHFQLTNLALSLLQERCQAEESYQVRAMCRDSLNILHLTAINLNRPIVRRVLPDAVAINIANVDELERDLENIKEQNKNLQRSLIDRELENQLQTRTLAALRDELKALKESRVQENASCSHQKVYLADPEDNILPGSGNRRDFVDTTLTVEDSDEDVEETLQTDAYTKLAERTINNLHATAKLTERDVTLVADRHKDDHSSSELVNNPGVKRKVSVEISDSPSKKRSKLEGASSGRSSSPIAGPSHSETCEEKTPEYDDIQSMLADFVDSGPDPV